MDIRKFFGGGGSSSGSSALSVEKRLAGSPVRPKPREPSMNKRKKAFLSSDEDDSDPENPLPSHLAKKIGEAKSKKAKADSEPQKTKPVVDANLSKKKNGSSPLKPADPSGNRVVTRSTPPKKQSQSANGKPALQPIDVVDFFGGAAKSKPTKRPGNDTNQSQQREPPLAKRQKQSSDEDGDSDFEILSTSSRRSTQSNSSKSKASPSKSAAPTKITSPASKKPVPTKVTSPVSKKRVTSPSDKKKNGTATAPAAPAPVAPAKKTSPASKKLVASLSDKQKTSAATTPAAPAPVAPAKKTSPASKKLVTSPSDKQKNGAATSTHAPVKIVAPTLNKPAESVKNKQAPPPLSKPDPSVLKRQVPAASKPAEPSKPKVPPALQWVDKYKPISLNQLIGQQGDKSPVNKLLNWLRNWASWHLGAAAGEKKARPPPWKQHQDDGSSFRAALLSGPPGIGKTTSAQLVCRELGLLTIEMNASDTRNKKSLDATVAELIGNTQIEEYFGLKAKKAPQNKVSHVLIMDEVDGMSGNQDRAGIQELIAMIKSTKIPMLCICNDRQAQKIRSLAGHCFDLRFPRPRVEQFRGRLMTIASSEGLKLNKEKLDELIESSNHDVRQAIYNLHMISAGGTEADIKHKDVAINVFEAARKLMSSESSLIDKSTLFFTDYSLMPLFVHENYPSIVPHGKKSTLEKLDDLRKAADSVSLGDVTDCLIRTSGSWTLLNELSMFSSVLPTMYMGGHVGAQMSFPSWLGKNSTRGKRSRLLQQLAAHTRLHASTTTQSMLTDYVPAWRDRLTRPLIEKEQDGVREVIDTYELYDLTRDDSEAIAELSLWPGRPDPASKIAAKVKAAVTRAFNKEKILLPYATGDVAKGKRRATGGGGAEQMLQLDEEGNPIYVDEEDEEGAGSGNSSDEETAPSAPPKKKPPSSAAQSTRGGGRGRGRGRGRGKAD